MHSALLVIEKPDLSIIENQQAWSALQATISDILNNNAIPQDVIQGAPKRLGENVLIIPLNAYLNIFVTITSVAQNNQLSYQVLFLDQEPQWVYSK